MKFTTKTRSSHLFLDIAFNDEFWRSHLRILYWSPPSILQETSKLLEPLHPRWMSLHKCHQSQATKVQYKTLTKPLFYWLAWRVYYNFLLNIYTGIGIAQMEFPWIRYELVSKHSGCNLILCKYNVNKCNKVCLPKTNTMYHMHAYIRCFQMYACGT